MIEEFEGPISNPFGVFRTIRTYNHLESFRSSADEFLAMGTKCGQSPRVISMCWGRPITKSPWNENTYCAVQPLTKSHTIVEIDL